VFLLMHTSFWLPSSIPPTVNGWKSGTGDHVYRQNIRLEGVMFKKPTFFYFPVLIVSLFCNYLSSYERSREVKVIWDYDKKELYIFENGRPVEKPLTFILRTDDRLVLGIKIEGDTRLFSIGYKLLPPKTPYELPGEISSIVTAEQAAPTRGIQAKEMTPDVGLNVTDDLPSGGRLLVSFIKKNTDGKTEQVDDILLKIKHSYPLFLPSTGVVFSNETDPTISIVNNEKGESVVVYKNRESTGIFDLRPKQDLIQFFNFRVYEGLYFSFGCPVTLSKNLYENPHLGLAFYPGQNLAYVILGGIAFHKEAEILSSSGYKENQVVDSSLKADSIPTEQKYHVRFFVGISFRLK